MENYIHSDKPLSSYKTSIILFTRDLRIHDNYTLEIAGRYSENLIGCFIFSEKQINKNKNKYYSDYAVKFMLESLTSLNKILQNKLIYLTDITQLPKADAIFISRDYTLFAQEREKSLKKLYNNVIVIDNHLLEYPGASVLLSGNHYQKFTPYYNFVESKYKPIIVKSQRFKDKFIKITSRPQQYIFPTYDTHSTTGSEIIGGREYAVKLLHKNMANYKKTHNDPNQPTTRLAAYLKFGCISPREVYQYYKIKHNNDIIRQLWWREFYYNIAIGFPHVLHGKSLKESYDKIQWENRPNYIKAWKNGTTGYDFVDAGIHQLKLTGFMHNRLRLVVASFLVKDLHVDWRVGERFFANYLIDYDPIINNGNWQWVAGCGADSQPYFRIFNPILQMKTYDPQELYIKKYLIEKTIKQIVNHDDEKIKTLKYYKIKN